MWIRTGKGEFFNYPSEGTVESVINGLPRIPGEEKRWAVLIKSERDNEFMQARVVGKDTFVVEYREDFNNTQFIADEVSPETTVALLCGFLKRTAFRHAVPWKALETKNNLRYDKEGTEDEDFAVSEGVTSDTLNGFSFPSGVVYLLKAGPFYKIGKSTDLNKRLSQIRLQMPFPVELIRKIETDDPTSLEAHWHKMFASQRSNGEWFVLTESDVLDFMSYNDI